MKTLQFFLLCAAFYACQSGANAPANGLSGDSLLSMMKKPAPAAPAIPDADSETPNFTTRYDMEVQDAQGLLDELHSGVFLRLQRGDYAISDLNSKNFGAWYAWDNKHIANGKAPKMLVLHDLDSVHLKGQNAILRNQTDGASILVLRNCRNIVLEDLKLQNLCSQERSTGGALVLIDCENIYVQHCELAGYNAFALDASNSKNIHLHKNNFQSCHHQVISLQSCENVSIKNTEIKNNTPAASLIKLSDCNKVEMANLKMHNNVSRQQQNADIAVLELLNSRAVSWRNSQVDKNTLGRFLISTGGEAVQLDNVAQTNNYFVKSE